MYIEDKAPSGVPLGPPTPLDGLLTPPGAPHSLAQVGAVYGMDLTTIENAVFFLDEYIFAQMSGGKVLCREDFQVGARSHWHCC